MTFSNSPSNRNILLTAACLAAGLFLAGCEQPISASAEAQKAAQEAAHQAASAGNQRGTNDLIDAALAAGLDDAGLENTLKGNLSKYVKRNSVEQDLMEAVTKLRGSTTAVVSNADKAGFLFTMGATQLQLSGERHTELQALMPAITDLCNTIEVLAASALDVASQAETLDAWAKKNPPKRDAATAAATGAAAAKKAIDDKQTELTNVQNQINTKQAQARQIYAAADAAFAAADQKKGKESIDAANKAVADRKQGDQLMQEASNLSLQLTQLQGQVAILTVRAKDAETLKTMTEASYTLAVKNDEQITARVTLLREAGKKIIEGPTGLAAQLKSLRDLTAAADKKPDLNTRIEQAAKAAADAASAFTQSASSYSAYIGELRDKTAEADAKDPLKVLVNDSPRLLALTHWSKAAALQQEAQVQFTGAQIGISIDRAFKTASRAGEKFGMKAEAPTAINSATLLGNAKTKFQEASDAADLGLNQKSKDTDLLKWIGYSMKALAKQGLSVAANDKAALAEARTARDEASKISPAAGTQLSWIGQ